MDQKVRKMSMLEMVYEHNVLNGFRFVLIEFVIVACAALYIGSIGLSKGSPGFVIAGLGIAANSGAICLTVCRQLRRGDTDLGIYETYFGKRKAQHRTEYPDRDRNTMIMCMAFLCPFLLTILILRARRD